jgi:hypothetical protein
LFVVGDFAAMPNSAATSAIADIEQATPINLAEATD